MERSSCFIGHKRIQITPMLKTKIKLIVINLIEEGKINFLFGDNSDFDTLCYEIVSELKEEYPEIRRIKCRKDYEDADEYTIQFLVSGYEDSICPKGVCRAGKASYVERNKAMIRESEVCIFYYDENYKPSPRKVAKNSINDYQPKSGTALAFEYAKANKKAIINIAQ